MTFKHRLVTAGDQARGVSAKIGEFDDQTSKSGTRPSRLIRPDGQILKKLIDNGFGRASKTLAEGSEGGQREGMLHFEHFAKKRVLACEVRLVTAADAAISSMLTRVKPLRRNRR